VETGVTEREGLEKDRERESVVVLSGGELDGGRRAIMWVSPHNSPQANGHESHKTCQNKS